MSIAHTGIDLLGSLGVKTAQSVGADDVLSAGAERVRSAGVETAQSIGVETARAVGALSVDVEMVQSLLPDWSATAWLLATLLGEVWVLVIALTAAYWFTGRDEVGALFGVVLAALSVTLALKVWLAHPRPTAGPLAPAEAVPELLRPLYESETTDASPGFPSGHATGATVTWGALALVLEAGRRRHRLAAAGGVITLVCLSRVALGVHAPIDVVAGVLLGAACLAVAVPLVRRADDPLAPAFAVALLVSLLAVPIAGVGSEAASALGAAIGGVAARLGVSGDAAPFPATPTGAGVAAVALAAILAVGLSVGTLAGDPAEPVVSTALVGSGLLATPSLRG
ncbi:Membrane-associated phospholipid phosphatase [Natronoarchaeum philippinense]|uniref:Membrane-associated phospholipid phosphatase n=1 Tax=Natronoarchaeum philippinense TaxID=558529 RepID=A0A285P6Q9_NATPI|nr:phosphatase PAP2 family protein [Natronoarchaeum philippinense]SNZ17420.1 Membrane-associated phospholipid phosphatase [Natronoarchaeum philippinense]